LDLPRSLDLAMLAWISDAGLDLVMLAWISDAGLDLAMLAWISDAAWIWRSWLGLATPLGFGEAGLDWRRRQGICVAGL
jgi:hypothetical protein